jgi:hypothetical protein
VEGDLQPSIAPSSRKEGKAMKQSKDEGFYRAVIAALLAIALLLLTK